MNEDELRDALRDAVPDGESDARRRAWQVVQAAAADVEPGPRRRRRGRLVLLAVLTALVPIGAAGGAAASAPDSAVGRWVRDVLGVGARDAQPALVRVPGGGRLLVQSGDGTWVVSADGARRRLGRYAGAAWSPNGLFVVAWQGRELTALTPGGEVRWSLARPARVSLARWAPVDGHRIAYLAGGELRVVYGDGTSDRRLAAQARRDVAAAWRPDTTHVLAYVDARDRITVVAADSRQRIWRSRPVADPVKLSWSPDGRRLLAVTRRALVVFDRAGRRMYSRPLPAGAVLQDAEWSPAGSEVAIVRRFAAAGRSEVLLLDPARGLRGRTLFGGPGRFAALAWSPGGERLLIGWREPDQWLFLRPIRPRAGRVAAAVGNIARQFMPGATGAPFPRSVQWCCGPPP
jgi:Tol biopolymer transport system component